MNTVLLLAISLSAPGPKDAPAKPHPIVGEWTLHTMAVGGKVKRSIEDFFEEFTADGKWIRYGDDKKKGAVGRYTLDPKADPKAIDLIGRTDIPDYPAIQAIFKVEGNTLTICMPQDQRKVRPIDFEMPKDNQTAVYVFKRVKKD
jgi:uncharacterized protein (TIGR03067 family)